MLLIRMRERSVTVVGNCINFACEDASKTICKPLFDNGVWSHNSRLHPNTLQMKLGLLCDDAFMDELFEKIDKGLAQAVNMKK